MPEPGNPGDRRGVWRHGREAAKLRAREESGQGRIRVTGAFSESGTAATIPEGKTVLATNTGMCAGGVGVERPCAPRAGLRQNRARGTAV